MGEFMKYNEEIESLQVELLKMQTHVKNKGLRIALIFEGRDAAGKGGTLKNYRTFESSRRKSCCS